MGLMLSNSLVGTPIKVPNVYQSVSSDNTLVNLVMVGDGTVFNDISEGGGGGVLSIQTKLT